MSETAHQRKQQALIRVAESRLAAVHAVDNVCAGSKRWSAALPISPRSIFRIAAGVGVGSALLSTLLGARKSSRKAQKVVAQPWGGLLPQLLAAFLVPMLQVYVRRHAAEASSAGDFCKVLSKFLSK